HLASRRSVRISARTSSAKMTQEKPVKFLISVVLLSSTLCAPAFCEKQTAAFQKGQILTLERLPGEENSNRAGSSDDPLDSEVYRYDLFIQLGDMVYIIRLDTHDQCDTEYSPGSEVEARAGKKVMYLKRASGKVEEASVVGKRKARGD